MLKKTFLLVALAQLAACDDTGSLLEPLDPAIAHARNRSPATDEVLRGIVFSSDRDGNFELYLMNRFGSDVRRLTNHPAVDAVAAPSPDGTTIAFASDRDGGFEIYSMTVDGRRVRRLTNQQGHDVEPTWSPDGRKIAFRSGRDGKFAIYVMNANGSHVTRLTDDLGVDLNPAWSPDGRQIAFERSGEIYVASADGSGFFALTDHPALDAEPAWSPDGTRIAFRSDRDGIPSIYVMNADGSDVTRITGGTDGEPAWAPNGEGIAFTRHRDGSSDIYFVSPSGLMQLTFDPARDINAAWSPARPVAPSPVEEAAASSPLVVLDAIPTASSVQQPRVQGSGNTMVSGALRTFSFTARLEADGTAQGMAQIDNRSIDEMFQLELDCLQVVGNVAIMSGVFTRHTDVNAIGLTGIFGVVDSGEGTSADLVTQVFFFRPGTATCRDFGPSDVAEYATRIVSGNVQVR